MKQLQLVDRIVVEIMAEQGSELSNRSIANQLRMIADEIEDDGLKGNSYTDEDLTQGTPEHGLEMNVLWERECPAFGLRMGNRSLIHDAYYGGGKAPNVLDEGEFSVASINRQDLIDLGYDQSNLSDDDMQSIASRMGKAYHEGYCECWSEDLRYAADYLGIIKLRGSIAQHLNDILVDDETEEGGVSHHGETLREFLEEIGEDKLKKKGIDYLDDVSVLDDILEECGIVPIGLED